MAKQLAASGGMAIDLPAGPSEVAIVADGSVPASFIAADLLSRQSMVPTARFCLPLLIKILQNL
jgi:histidinol dehydrogenase